MTKTEQTLIAIRNELLAHPEFGKLMTKKDAEKIALAGAVAALQTDAACGTKSNIDRDELLAIVDRIGGK